MGVRCKFYLCLLTPAPGPGYISTETPSLSSSVLLCLTAADTMGPPRYICTGYWLTSHLGPLVPDPEAAVHPRRHPRLRRHVRQARLLQAARGVTCLVSLGRLIIQLIRVCLLWSPPLTLFSLAGMETVLTEPSWKVDTLPWSHKNTAQGNWCTTGKFELFYRVYI